MKQRIIALLLIFALIFSLTACKSADEEESAVSGNVTSDNVTDSTPSDDTGGSNEQSGTQTAPDTNDQTQQPSTDNEQTGSAPDDDGDDTTPSLSTSSDFTVTFDYGYDNKKETEKTEDKVTEIKPERKGYTFDGWYNGDTKWDFAKDTVSADTVLTAKWNTVTYTIAYNANGATLPAGNPTTYTVETENIELEPAAKTGGVFVGWSYPSNGGTVTVNTIAKGTVGDLVLTPVWSENELSLGTYEQDGDTSNGKEPIIWIKLKEENGKALYLSKYILDGKPYQSPKKSVSWSTCSLRKWLNDSFYKTAFSAADKELVLQQDIHTPVNSQTGVGTAVDTKDSVILLSLEESEELTTWSQRKAEVTKYAASQGCIVSDDGTGDWWLRSAGCYDNYAALVQENSGIRENGYSVDLTTIGVRPAIWVDTSKLG